jgi:hypothetical protein
MIHITKPLSDDIQNIASYSPNHQAKVNKRFETKSKEKKKKEVSENSKHFFFHAFKQTMHT